MWGADLVTAAPDPPLRDPRTGRFLPGHRKIPGSGQKKGTPNRWTCISRLRDNLAERAEGYSAILQGIASDKTARASDRIRAATTLLEFGLGRPPVAVEVDVGGEERRQEIKRLYQLLGETAREMGPSGDG